MTYYANPRSTRLTKCVTVKVTTTVDNAVKLRPRLDECKKKKNVKETFNLNCCAIWLKAKQHYWFVPCDVYCLYILLLYVWIYCELWFICCSVLEPAVWNAELKMNSTSLAVWSLKNLNLKNLNYVDVIWTSVWTAILSMSVTDVEKTFRKECLKDVKKRRLLNVKRGHQNDV